MAPSRPLRSSTRDVFDTSIPSSRAERFLGRSNSLAKLEDEKLRVFRLKTNKRALVAEQDAEDCERQREDVIEQDGDLSDGKALASDKENARLTRRRGGNEQLPTPKATPTKKKARVSAIDSAPSSAPSSAAFTQITNIYTHATQLLSTSSANSADLPFLGRTKEIAVIKSFLNSRFPGTYESDLPQRRAPTLYISGPPGIGKTAALLSVLGDFKPRVHGEVRVHMENCSSLGSVGLGANVWERLGVGLGLWSRADRVAPGREGFRERLFASQEKCLVVLDEIDHLLSAKPSSPAMAHRNLLTTLFALAHEPDSPLTLVGIANALDLTTRSLHLDRLSSSSESATALSAGPLLLHFEPYKAVDMSAIIMQRLALLSDHYPLSPTSPPTSFSGLPCVDAKALELCTRKVERASGDMRTALEIVREAIGLVERREWNKLSPSKSSTSTSSPRSDPLSSLTPDCAPRAGFQQVMAAIAAAKLASPKTLPTQLAALNFAARNALVGCVIALSRSDVASVRMSEAYEVYRSVLRDEGTVSPLSRAEFIGTVELTLVGRGAFMVLNEQGTPGSGGRRKKVVFDNSAADPLVSLSSSFSITDLSVALKTTPGAVTGAAAAADYSASYSSGGSTKIFTPTSAGALEETLRISINLLIAEERRVSGMQARKLKTAKDELAPRAGFKGDGLEESGRWIGGKKKHVDAAEESEPIAGEGSEDW